MIETTQTPRIPREWSDRLTLIIDSQSNDHCYVTSYGSVSSTTKDIANALLEKFFANGGVNAINSILDDKHVVVERPGIYPLLHGGIQFEWSDNSIDWSIEIPNNGDIEISAFGFGKAVDWDAMIMPYGEVEDVADKVFKQYSLMRDNVTNKQPENNAY